MMSSFAALVSVFWCNCINQRVCVKNSARLAETWVGWNLQIFSPKLSLLHYRVETLSGWLKRVVARQEPLRSRSSRWGFLSSLIFKEILRKPHYNYGLILTPTRELALQIRQHFLDIGSEFGLRVLCLVGGQHVEDQYKALKNVKHHIIVGTPGRVVYHIENSTELSLRRIRFFVLDEADRMLGGDFDSQLETILSRLPEKRKTYLFSATMTGNVGHLYWLDFLVAGKGASCLPSYACALGNGEKIHYRW